MGSGIICASVGLCLC